MWARCPRTASRRAARPDFATRNVVLATALCLTIGRVPPALAAPGDLDPTLGGFGSGGFVLGSGQTEGMAVAPDGKIVTVRDSGVQVAITRYRPDGSLDPTFDGDGTAILLNPAFDMNPEDVVVQPDGRIVVVGWAGGDYFLARANPTGTIDASFGSGGYVTTDFNAADYASEVLIQPDGMIVVAGTSVAGDEDFSVARYHPDGSLDMTFGGDGKVTIGFGGDEVVGDMALQEDGKLVLAGQYEWDDGLYDWGWDFAVARLNPDGTLDDGFDYDGKASAGLGGIDFAKGVAIQADGKIVLAGNRDFEDGVLARFLPNGQLDPSLDADGKMTVPGSGRLWGVAIQPDGRILLVGEHPTGNDNLFAFHRLDANGSLDPTFEGDGHAFFDLGITDMGQWVALLPDGRILAGGITGSDPDPWDGTEGLLIRLWPDGSVDVGGQQALAFDDALFPPGSDERANAMAIQSDGKIVVAGWVATADGSESDVALARFLPDGELDTSFGTHGLVSFSFHNSDYARAVAIQPDGKIVVAGSTGSGDAVNFLVARFLPDGALDGTFGFGGFNVLDFLGGADYATAVAIAPDGKVVVAGTVFNGAADRFGVARFTGDGVADNSLDGDAKQVVEFEPGVPHYASAVVVQPDRKIVVGGSVNGDFALLRLHENGSLDDTFGCQGGVGGGGTCSGRARIDMGGSDYLQALGRAPNGWLYAGGTRNTSGVGADFAVAQFNENGRLASCPPFPCENWHDGKAYMDQGIDDFAYALDVRGDGQVVVAGIANGIVAWAQFGPTNTNPIIGAADLGPSESATAVRFTGSNHLVVAGYQVFNDDESILLARFETTPGPIVDVPAVGAPDRTAIEALGPNPSAGSASLTFVLAQASPVEVRVHDVSGRRIRVVDAGLLPAGRHGVIWDGRGDDGSPAGAGVYFVSLRLGGRQVGGRRLTILR